ncbi:MAG TPA: hypothetical protein VNA65_11975 [Candidatus Dormibacteraeota bacterium]|nr:hypothetical protein [Candidatus Dormibacteraeota bacterium]
MAPEPATLVALMVAGLAFAVGLAPTRQQQRRLVIRGTTGLAGAAMVALAPTLILAIPVLVGLGVLHASVGGRSKFTVRLRPIAMAAGLLALALLFAGVAGPDVLQRFAAIGAVAGLAAAIGVVPYLHELDPDVPASASPIAWLAFIGPLLASVAVLRVEQVLTVDADGVLGATLIGLGLLNLVWGSISAWRTETDIEAWRYSFVADWGLALCGFGLAAGDGRSAAVLILFTILLGRLPLYLVWQQSVHEKVPTERPINLVVAGLLAGSAPFAGFAGRILLLRGATQIYWPLAMAIAIGLLLWLPGSLRLGRSIGLPRARQAVLVAIVIALNVTAGLYPLPILSAAGY